MIMTMKLNATETKYYNQACRSLADCQRVTRFYRSQLRLKTYNREPYDREKCMLVILKKQENILKSQLTFYQNPSHATH